MPAPYVLAIDAGHGGSPTSDPAVLWDPGVVAGSLMEKNLTLDMAFRLKALLEKERVRVVMTRTTDRYLEISERWNLVHASGARLFVSLHVNAFDGDPSINGSTVFYPRADSQAFAQQLEAGLAASLQPFGVPDDGIAPKPELWIHADIPTATVEPAYLTNPHEAALLARSDFRDAIAAGLFQGLLSADPKIEATAKQIQAVEQARAARQQAEAAATARLRRWQLAGAGTAVVLAGIGLGLRRRLRRRNRPRRPSGRRRSAMIRPAVRRPARDLTKAKK
jgi:N-acetylmuramoyl-L-alanine amidase